MLRSFERPWIRALTRTPSEATNALWAAASADERLAVRFLRGKKMATETAVLDEFAAALQFPYYFGDNWNALDESLVDLSWVRADAFILCVLDANLVLPSDDDAFASLMRMLHAAGEEWSSETEFRSAKPFHVVLQCESAVEDRLRSRLNRASVDWETWEGPRSTDPE
jgi:hypothetical protein